jgi:hypothetical protein
MFGILKRNRPQRQLFKYSDGVRTRCVDPVMIMRAMIAHEKLNLETHLPQLTSEFPELQNEAAEIVVSATREIFGLKPFSDLNRAGLTELETIDVLNDFVIFTETLKKNGSGQPT